MEESLQREEVTRYSRHILLENVGKAGQLRLKRSRVFIVGVGGLGHPAAQYLAAAGVGTLGLCDHDTVALTNLQRQILFRTDDIGRYKVEVARQHLLAINPHISIQSFAERVTAENLPSMIKEFDVVVDCTDNFASRYVLNDVCMTHGIPLVHGSIFRFDGQITTFMPNEGPCYRCLFPAAPPADKVQNCSVAGVFGVLPGVIGTLQATETLKILLGLGDLLTGRLLVYDALGASFRTFQFAKDPHCPVCAANSSPGATKTDSFGIAPESNDWGIASQVVAADPDSYLLIDIRSPQEREIVSLPLAVAIAEERLLAEISGMAPTSKQVIIFCKSGTRSRRAVETLRQAGHHHVKQLRGGILAWIENHAPDLPTY